MADVDEAKKGGLDFYYHGGYDESYPAIQLSMAREAGGLPAPGFAIRSVEPSSVLSKHIAAGRFRCHNL